MNDKKVRYKFKGTWKNGRKNGEGWELFSDQSEFNGVFEDGERHGIGMLISADGS